MASRIEAQRDRQEQGATAPTVRRQDSGGAKEVSLTAFRMQFPGLVSMGGDG
jgi:hypothetical protein